MGRTGGSVRARDEPWGRPRDRPDRSGRARGRGRARARAFECNGGGARRLGDRVELGLNGGGRSGSGTRSGADPSGPVAPAGAYGPASAPAPENQTVMGVRWKGPRFGRARPRAGPIPDSRPWPARRLRTTRKAL